jgi:Tol biopolymer transport system component
VSAFEMWRMNSDGSNRKKLEDYAGDPQLSPDGQWIVYTSFFEGKFTLQKISTNGGKPVTLIDNPAFAASLSHDGKKIACFLGNNTNPDRLSIAVLPFEGGKPSQIYDLPRDISEYSRLRWTLSEDALYYIVDSDGISNIYRLPLNGNSPVKITDFKEKLMFYFDWSYDGDLACSRGELVNDVVLLKDLK